LEKFYGDQGEQDAGDCGASYSDNNDPLPRCSGYSGSRESHNNGVVTGKN
jgi:hypothetical protein